MRYYNQSTKLNFIEKSRLIHGDKYDYSLVEYINNRTKVCIVCTNHGNFIQRPDSHLQGNGCKKCAIKNKSLSTKNFIQKAKEIHGNRYDYSKVNYINNHTKVIIICKEHGEFEQIANYHLNGSGCSTCSGSKKSSTEEFIQKAKEIHGDRYDYSKVVYVNNSTKVIIICKEHGEFEQKPTGHISGKNCFKCKGKQKLSTEEFISKANEVHGDKYDYSKVEYINWYTKVPIICKEHGEFWQRPNDHTDKPNNCPKCSNQGYSNKAITWLNKISNKENIHIQHAENEGEYLIPGTRYKADGYCKKTNTIYEFYGDYFHGNLNLFEEDELCHPYKDECAGSLYMKTKQREQEIKDKGYNLITIWENEYEIKKIS